MSVYHTWISQKVEVRIMHLSLYGRPIRISVFAWQFSSRKL